MKNKSLLFVIVISVLSACTTSPTGRSQLLLMPESQMHQMGVAAFDDLKKKTKVVRTSTTNSYVSCVARAITRSIKSSKQPEWEVVVFDDKSANAFALPGGKIGVHTGLLAVATDQNQLAAVIGHEVGHVLAQHGNERMSIEFASQTSQQLLGAMMEEGAQKGMLMGALGLGAQVGVQLPFSRSHESEADLMGLQLMADAGFDPQASVQLWKNMSANQKGAPPEFLSTHPSHATRISHLKANIPRAMPSYIRVKNADRLPRCKP
jgi:predicted Zn-dependent protease